MNSHMQADLAEVAIGNEAPANITARPTRWIELTIVAAATALGTGMAFHYRWVCDDAFISYRYALNLFEGKGLVFNAGEPVEGYSNFLWTLWCVPAFFLKLTCEQWTIGWGIFFYAASLGLLGYHSLLVRRAVGPPGVVLSIAAILGAVHKDWAIYATSGLETSLFTFLAILGYVLLAKCIIDGRQRPVAVGIVMALCALTRPDGAVFAIAAGLMIVWLAWPRWNSTLLYVLAFGIPEAAHLLWRISYYGDWLPNTYYAKSANLAWWAQGCHYLILYIQKYAVLCLSVPAFLACVLAHSSAVGQPPQRNVLRRLAICAALFGFAYTLVVTRVGGDFMYARMLIPATPFFMILIELVLLRTPLSSSAIRVSLVMLLVLGFVLPPDPIHGYDFDNGVANERNFYAEYLFRERKSDVLREYLADLPVCVAFMGSEAHAMYRARIPIAIESEAGLTDRFIAHQPLKERGRVGHEKNAPLDYLIRTRKAHFTFHPAAEAILRLPESIVQCGISLGNVHGWVLHWDPPIIDALRRRGAKIDDLPGQIDAWIAEMDRVRDSDVAELYGRLKLMYFEHVSDAGRENAFKNRLGRRG